MLSAPPLSPACDERINAARKVATELVNVSWHVVIVVRSRVRGKSAAQALQGMKCLRQHRERARGALRLPARAR